MRTEENQARNLKQERYQLEQMLSEMSSKGVTLYLDNRVAGPRDVAAKTVREDCPYMADYIFSDAGELVQLRFDRLRR